MDYSEHVRILAEGDPELARELADCPSLRRLLVWLESRRVPLGRLDSVAQDEFSHDLVALLPDGRWISFGVT